MSEFGLQYLTKLCMRLSVVAQRFSPSSLSLFARSDEVENKLNVCAGPGISRKPIKTIFKSMASSYSVIARMRYHERRGSSSVGSEGQVSLDAKHPLNALNALNVGRSTWDTHNLANTIYPALNAVNSTKAPDTDNDANAGHPQSPEYDPQSTARACWNLQNHGCPALPSSASSCFQRFLLGRCALPIVRPSRRHGFAAPAITACA